MTAPEPPPSAALLRAIGFSERTASEIAGILWPAGGQTELQGAAMAVELRRLTRCGVLQAFPGAPPLLANGPKRYSFRLTLKGRELLSAADADEIMRALGRDTQPDLPTLEIEEEP